ncbi:MAG: hypothetical protein EPN89_18375, partial [Methylovulum sp.]
MNNNNNNKATEKLMKSINWQELDGWMTGLLFVQIRALGIFSQTGVAEDPDTLRQQAGITERYRRWWDECLRILQSGGYLQCADGLVSVAIEPEAGDAVWQAWDQHKQRYLDDAELQTSVNLVDACLRQLPGILRGDVQATDILFPSASMANVERMYRKNAVVDY